MRMHSKQIKVECIDRVTEKRHVFSSLFMIVMFSNNRCRLKANKRGSEMKSYWRELKRIGAIDQVHLWNYTDVPRDLEYIRRVAKKYSSFLKIMEPEEVPLPETALFFDRCVFFEFHCFLT